MAALVSYRLPPRNAVIALLVVVAHVVVIAWMLHAALSPVPVAPSVRETLLWLSLAPRAKVQPPQTPAIKPEKRPAVAPTRLPDYPAIASPPTPDASSLEGLHAFLFNCTPENLANLTPEQRAQCASPGSKPHDSVDYADHSGRAHQAARWAHDLARKQAPLLLPCANAQGISPLATLACLGKSLVTGFDLNAPGYADKPDEAHVPNGGDPPDGPRR
jgi:hypothetical protein